MSGALKMAIFFFSWLLLYSRVMLAASGRYGGDLCFLHTTILHGKNISRIASDLILERGHLVNAANTTGQRAA